MGKSYKKHVTRPQTKKNEGNTPKNGKDLIRDAIRMRFYDP